ncbi:MAG: hypothetical protein SVS85_00295, partial [Candidatus Nanohaloarchaea archaeon]|nr:hypothetical protein [Candidatus Nanohaloarchaea archaeon]
MSMLQSRFLQESACAERTRSEDLRGLLFLEAERLRVMKLSEVSKRKKEGKVEVFETIKRL